MKLHEKTIYWHKSVCVHPPGPALKSVPDHYPGRLSLIIKIRKEPDNDNIIKVPVLRWQPREKLKPDYDENVINPNRTKEYMDEMTGGAGDREWSEIAENSKNFELNEINESISYSDDESTVSTNTINSNENRGIERNSSEIESFDSPRTDLSNENLAEFPRPSMSEKLNEYDEKVNKKLSELKISKSNTNSVKFLKSDLFDDTCSFFQTDLDHVRSIRAHFNRGGSYENNENTQNTFAENGEENYDPRDDCGQMILASLDSQYKTFHFHNGGLQIIVRLLLKWSKAAKQSIDKIAVPIYAHPALNDRLCHPLQILYPHMLSINEWYTNLDINGKVLNPKSIKEHIFFIGCEPNLRPQLYPFLLDVYSWKSTSKERSDLLFAKHYQYEAINKRRISILENINKTKNKTDTYININSPNTSPRKNANIHVSLPSHESITANTANNVNTAKHKTNSIEIEYHSQDEEVEFLKEVQNIVEKDVLRTDRQHLYFSGSRNKNLDKLRRILLNYSTLTHKNYTQGMSDLASPLLMLFDNEALCFWCFVGLMEKHKYISSPKDEDIRKELVLLRRLIKFLVPKFYRHMLNMGPGSQDLLFAHRWVLLLFKREWSNPEDGLLVWEAIWSQYQTKHFHLFIACAFVELYGQDPVVMKLDLDETLLHFSQVTGHVDAEEVLRRARKLIYNVKSSKELPCYINDIAHSFSAVDENYSGKISCIGHLNGKACVFGQKTQKDQQIENVQNQIGKFKINLKNNLIDSGSKLKSSVSSSVTSICSIKNIFSRYSNDSNENMEIDSSEKNDIDLSSIQQKKN